MKLRKLSVNQFKLFTVPTQLGELGDGLNLVVGPNELGKSTLLDALRAVLFERYSSRARPIEISSRVVDRCSREIRRRPSCESLPRFRPG